MQSDDVKAFKNELRNYNYNLNRVVTLKNSIEYCYDRLGGVRGIDTSKEPTHSLPNKDLEYKLRDDIERYRRLQSVYETKVEYVDEILSRIETSIRKAIISVHVEHKKTEKVARECNLSTNGLQYRMDKAIERALNDENNQKEI